MTRKHLLIIFDVLVLVLCIAGIEQSRLKAWLDAEIESHEVRQHDQVRVKNVSAEESTFRTGDVLLTIAGYQIRELQDVEQILDRFEAGSTVSMTFRRDGQMLKVSYRLRAYYSVFDLIMQASGTLIFFLLALFVVSRRPDGSEALLFHQLAITVAAVIAFTNGFYEMKPFGVGYVLRALFPSVNVFIGVLMLHFSLVFPRPKPVPRSLLGVIYGAAALVSLIGAYTSLRATLPIDMDFAPLYYRALSVAKLGMVLGAVTGIGVLIYRFRVQKDAIARKQIAWVVLGAGFSVAVYVLFWQLTTSPYIRALLPAGGHALLEFMRIQESVLIFSLVLTGLFMSIGIIRYRFFDIEYFFRRGTIYGLLFLFLILVYSGILWIVYRLSGNTPDFVFIAGSIIALVIDLLLFVPTRDFVQRIVDRYFFRVEYDFRAGLKSLTDDISGSVDAEEVARRVVDGIDALMHLYGVMVMTVHERKELRVLARSGFPRWNYPSISVHERRIQSLPRKPLLLSDVVEAGADVTSIAMPFALRYGVSLIYTLRAEDGEVLGLLILGQKRSGSPFTLEDLDLLHSVSMQSGLHLERLRLQEHLLMEKKEAEKLRELSQMKSYFVSGVSHDLKTPLTSIKLFAELLEQQIPREDAGSLKYVSIIQGECDRLGRMINNVLDFTKIERGMMKYTFELIDVNELMRRAYDVMQYQFVMGGFTCEVDLCDEALPVQADADALIEAVTNILSNALKYSGSRKEVHLRTRRRDESVEIEIQDHGLGIDPRDIPHLFEPFYRSQTGDVQKHGGVGLGLALVKHIIDAHEGRIDVRSTPGEGSTFIISLNSVEAA